jgi:APA family basic amino acid/polyamine antiporter
MKHKIKHFKLKRELGLLELTLYGIGAILGAGIYVLIGPGAGIAGYGLWLSFIIAAVIASFTGLSFAELSSIYPKEASTYVYTERAFHHRLLSFITSWVLIISGIVSAATVSLGFAGYFIPLFGGEPIIVAASLIIALSFLNYVGIKISARFNCVSTVIEISGLLLVILIGAIFIFSMDDFNIGNYFTMPSAGIAGIFTATTLIFFAYLGFEDVVIMSEETKNAKKNVPKALLLALTISTILYVLVSFSSISVLTPAELSSSDAPLTNVVEKVVPRASFLMSFIALFATANTVLILLIVMSRMFCGISREHSLPRAFARIGDKGTPYISVFLIMFLALGSLLIGRIETVAMLTNAGVFISFIFVNLSLIFLRYKKPKIKRPFKVPFNIGRFPVLAFLGAASSLFMLLYIGYNDLQLLLFEAAVILLGIAAFKFFNRKTID